MCILVAWHYLLMYIDENHIKQLVSLIRILIDNRPVPTVWQVPLKWAGHWNRESIGKERKCEEELYRPA